MFSATINLTDNTDTWYRKVREIIDKQQSNALWMSESKVSISQYYFLGFWYLLKFLVILLGIIFEHTYRYYIMSGIVFTLN